MASNLVAMASTLAAMASKLVAMAYKLVAMASTLVAMASTLAGMASILVAMANTLVAMASTLVAMASNLIGMASTLVAMASTLVVMATNLVASFSTTEPFVLCISTLLWNLCRIAPQSASVAYQAEEQRKMEKARTRCVDSNSLQPSSDGLQRVICKELHQLKSKADTNKSVPSQDDQV